MIRSDLPRLLLFSVLFLAGLCLPPAAMAANRVMDLKVTGTGPDRTTLALLMEREPRYSLRSGKENQVRLVIQDAESGPRLSRAIAAQGTSLTLEGDKPSTLIDMALHLKGSPREIECSWHSKEKVLLISVGLTGEPERKARKASKPASLKGLRFGVQDGLTRMVADVSEKPAWEWASGEGRAFSLRLGAIPKDPKGGEYGPMSRLRKVALTRKGDTSEIRIEPEGALSRVRMFWLKDGGKWVVDFFEQKAEGTDAALRFDAAEAEKEEEKTPQVVDANERKVPEPEPKAAPVSPSEVEPERPGSGDAPSKVRMKIAQAGETNPELKGDPPVAPPAQKAVRVRIDPRIRSSLQDAIPGGSRLQGLSTAEAFLYGKIQQALEIRDYEKGAALIDEFTGRFPESGLGEDLAFLAGDCRLALLERGERGLLPKVIQSYQDAISRFPGSRRVPEALLKTSQAHALAGNDYEAVGNLTMAISRHGETDSLPHALILRGQIFLRLNQVEKAISDFKTVMERFAGSPLAEEARYGMASYFHSVGMYEEAEKRLKEIETSQPQFYLEHPEYLLLRARNCFYRKDYDPAREYYFKALNLGHQPESSDLLLSHIGDTYYHQSREKEAEKFYRMAAEYYPESEGASIAKLRIAAHSSGVTAYEEVHRKNLNKPIGDLALLEMASKFYKKGQYTVAMETLKRLMGKPVQADIQREVKQLYFRSAEKEIRRHFDAGEYEKLITYYQSAEPPLSGNIDPETVLLVGEAFHHLKRLRQAVLHFSQINERDLNPVSRGKYVTSLAACYISQGDDENAKAFLEKTDKDKLAPVEQQKATLLLAGVVQRKGELRRAFDLYQTLLGEKRLLSDREMAQVYFSMGSISNRQNRYEKARESLNRCIALAEKNVESKDLLRSALVEMGNSFHGEGRHREAVRYYQQGLDLDYAPEMKGYWEVKYRLALSFLGTGENATAERIMSEIAEEGDSAFQQKAQIKIGLMGLEKQLKRLPLGQKAGSEFL
ncbi:MAG: tetratricopeptide repeat protein [Deltaproteobacteria bacterium]|nr:tetratricopeptide repeat protein [Deltaproteobacteria bacterium]